MLVDNVVPARVLVDRRLAKYKDEWDDATYEAIDEREKGNITRDGLVDTLEKLGWDRDVTLDLILEDEEE
jgi:hypothetical protein